MHMFSLAMPGIPFSHTHISRILAGAQLRAPSSVVTVRKLCLKQ